jgi:hypothetical protein
MRAIHVPMNVLLAYGTPYTPLLHGRGKLRENEIDMFFDGVHECVERWLYYLNQQIMAEPMSLPYHAPVENLRESLLKLTNDDGESVFETRKEAHHAIIEFEHLCTDMARSFTHPPRIKDFYHNLASRTRSTLEYLTDGDIE